MNKLFKSYISTNFQSFPETMKNLKMMWNIFPNHYFLFSPKSYFMILFLTGEGHFNAWIKYKVILKRSYVLIVKQKYWSTTMLP